MLAVSISIIHLRLCLAERHPKKRRTKRIKYGETKNKIKCRRVRASCMEGLRRALKIKD